MKIFNSGLDKDIIEAIELDICLIISSGAHLLNQVVKIETLLEMYEIQKLIKSFKNLTITATYVDVIVYCPRKYNILITIP
jgi:hypothetical protein